MKPGGKFLPNYIIVGIMLLLVIGRYAYIRQIAWGFALSLFLLGALVATDVHRLLARPTKALERETETIPPTDCVDQKITHDELQLELADRSRELADTRAILKQEIRERKRTEDALRQAEKFAQAADRAKDALLANMGHELRTPLNAILGFAELMSYDPNLAVEQRENLMTIERSGEQLLALVNDVLELAEIEAGRMTLQENDFDLHYALLGLEDLFSPRAQVKGVTLIFECAPDVPQYVRMDRGKLDQILINLLGNAIKFTEKGDITLQVRRVDESSREIATESGENLRFGHLPAGHLEFSITDTGMGIAYKELGLVFDVFVQTASGKLACRGAGLGMPLSRRLVRMMGGDLVVSSELEKGTVFKFDVPVGLTDASQVYAHHLSRRVIGLEPCSSIYRLLVVDDVDKDRKWLVNLLQPFVNPTSNRSFEVREAANGQEAIEIWEEWDPHLIWMDMRMPVLDGRKATRHIKTACERSAARSSPVIVALTACGLEEERELVRVTGCDHLVRKPLDDVQVLDTLVQHLGVRFIYAGDAAEE